MERPYQLLFTVVDRRLRLGCRDSQALPSRANKHHHRTASGGGSVGGMPSSSTISAVYSTPRAQVIKDKDFFFRSGSPVRKKKDKIFRSYRKKKKRTKFALLYKILLNNQQSYSRIFEKQETKLSSSGPEEKIFDHLRTRCSVFHTHRR